jgi:hypothetical protein
MGVLQPQADEVHISAQHDESTSNLVRHANSCNPADSSSTRAITSFAHGSSYTPQKLRMKLALWVARCNCPYTIIADPELIEILTDLNSKVIVPSPSTISRDIKEILKTSRLRVAQILQACLGYCTIFIH